MKLLRKFVLPLFMSVALAGCGLGTTTVSGGSSVGNGVYAIMSTDTLSVTAESQTSAAVVLFGDATGTGSSANFNVAISVVDTNESPVESSVVAVTTDPSSCSLSLLSYNACSIYVQSNESNLTESAQFKIKAAVTAVATGKVTNLTPIALTVRPTNESTPNMESGVLHFLPSGGSLSILGGMFTGFVTLDNSRNVNSVNASVTNNQGAVNTCVLSTTNNICSIPNMDPGSWTGTNTETYTVTAPGYSPVSASFTISGS